MTRWFLFIPFTSSSPLNGSRWRVLSHPGSGKTLNCNLYLAPLSPFPRSLFVRHFFSFQSPSYFFSADLCAIAVAFLNEIVVLSGNFLQSPPPPLFSFFGNATDCPGGLSSFFNLVFSSRAGLPQQFRINDVPHGLTT